MQKVLNHRLNKLQSYSLPSGQYVDLTLGSSGTSYTAPADGWYFIAKITSGTQYFDIGIYYSNDNLICIISDKSINGSTIRLLAPVKKGYKIKTGYNASGSTDYFRFIYAVGAAPQT